MIAMLTGIVQNFRERLTPTPLPENDDEVIVGKMRDNNERMDRIIEARFGRDVLRNMVLNRETDYHAFHERR